MIEFLLIFALGFLAAAILAMLITPAIYGRIVKLTEKRIEATVPLSHAEIKGKADLMRAGFASETAKLTSQLESERDQRTESTVRADKLQTEIAQIAGERILAEQHIEELITQAGDLRSEDRKKQQLIEKLSDTVRQYERIKTHDNTELARLHNDLMTISTEVESMRIDLAANSAEAESFRFQVDSLNMQRDQLLNDIETLAEAAQSMEKILHTEQESYNEARIELAAVQSSLVDREAMLEQTFDQIEQQKAQLEDQIASRNQERDKLLGDIEAAAASGREIQQNLEKEQHQHEATRIELAAVQSSLADRETELVQSRDEMEELRRKLGVEIESLNLERTRLEREIEVAAQNTRTLEETLQQEHNDHQGTRTELAARQSLLEDRIKQIAQANEQIEEHRQQLQEANEANREALRELKKTQRHGEVLAGRVENTKAALDKSRAAEHASREKLSELRTEGKQLQKETNAATALAGSLEQRLDKEREQSADFASAIKTKEQELAARGRQLEEALGDVSAHESELHSVKAEQARRDQDSSSAKKRGSDLEGQIDTLKTELQQSRATSLQYQEQLKKMRNEINRLHRHDALAQSNGAGPSAPQQPDSVKRDVNCAVRGRMEDLRQRHAALVDKLKNTSDTSADHGMREEIAAIAAAVVGLSGQREGKTSPIHKIISGAGSGDQSGSVRLSLARRAKSELEG
ncbi:MAG: hypothetical protein GY789_18320 [Hyphomicrobiales bacterium]|nr:hypothetical protein [Hyphomicrobiales bacterium]MCP5000944.1 hypothetical protein [Hyphomicrobiales bacterium]